MVLPEVWRPHDGSGVVDELEADGWSVTETRFVQLDLSGRPHPADPGDGWWCLAVASRRPFASVREIPLPRTIGDPVPRRAAVHVVVDADGPIDLVAFHLSSKLWWGAPVVQLLGLRREVGALGRDRPAILAGDANWWRRGLAPLLPGWRSAVRGATYPAGRPHSQIDHVLVRGLDVVRGEVRDRATGSDHRAIRATLRTAPPSAAVVPPGAAERLR